MPTIGRDRLLAVHTARHAESKHIQPYPPAYTQTWRRIDCVGCILLQILHRRDTQTSTCHGDGTCIG
ncbi:hypothetical protein BaRGS_00011439, partial [Batillaria attramentaria]